MSEKTHVPDFAPQWDLSSTPLKSTYLVCTTPRTGSNLLCFSLAKQGIGIPIEYLNLLGNGSTQEFYTRITNCDFKSDVANGVSTTEICSKYIPQVIKHRTTANGVFGMKIFAHHFTNLYKDGNLSGLSALLGCKPKIINLVRENLIDLTVSYIMAQTNQQWHSNMTGSTIRNTIYNFDTFFDTMKDLNEIQHKWNAIFRWQDYDVLRITYKELSQQYTDTLKLVNEHLGFTDLEIPTPPIQRQVSEEKQKLIDLFTKDCRRNARQVRSALQRVKNKHR